MQFKEQFRVRWADVDYNQHVRHSAYYDYGAYARIRFLQNHGFSSEDFQRLRIGPILFFEQCSFIKEIRLDELISINFLKGPIKEDGSQWTLYHEIFNEAGTKAAQIKVKGAWMDMTRRKLAAPEGKLAEIFKSLDDGADFTYGKD